MDDREVVAARLPFGPYGGQAQQAACRRERQRRVARASRDWNERSDQRDETHCRLWPKGTAHRRGTIGTSTFSRVTSDVSDTDARVVMTPSPDPEARARFTPRP